LRQRQPERQRQREQVRESHTQSVGQPIRQRKPGCQRQRQSDRGNRGEPHGDAVPDSERLGQWFGFPAHVGQREPQPFRQRLTLS